MSTSRKAIASLCGVALMAAGASAQSVAEYTFSVSPNTDVEPGDVLNVSVFGQAISGQIGNGSGIYSVNLSVGIAGGTLVPGSFISNAEVFGGTNFADDAEGFDTLFNSNFFTGNNFSSGLALFSFQVEAGSAPGPLELSTEMGGIVNVPAALGLPGAFQASVPYDVNHAFASFSIVPAPGAAALLGFGAMVGIRRRR